MDTETILEDLNLNFKEYRSLIEALDKKIQQLEAKAAQLAGAYVISEAIMYVQSIIPSASGGKRWIPVCLSASISVAFWMTFTTTVNDCLRAKRQQDSIFMEQEKLYRKMNSIRTGLKQQIDASRQSLANAFDSVRFKRYAYVWALFSALFSFTLLVSYALFSIPQI